MQKDHKVSSDSEEGDQGQQKKVSKQNMKTKREKKKKKLYVSESDEEDTNKAKPVKIVKKHKQKLNQDQKTSTNQNSGNTNYNTDGNNIQPGFKFQPFPVTSLFSKSAQSQNTQLVHTNPIQNSTLFNSIPNPKNLSKQKNKDLEIKIKRSQQKFEATSFGKDMSTQKVVHKNENSIFGGQPKPIFTYPIVAGKQLKCQNMKLHSVLLGPQVNGCGQLYNAHLLECVECRDKLMKKCLSLIEKISDLNKKDSLGGNHRNFNQYFCESCKFEKNGQDFFIKKEQGRPSIANQNQVVRSDNFSKINPIYSKTGQVKPNNVQSFGMGQLSKNKNKSKWDEGLAKPIISKNTKIDGRCNVKCISLKGEFESLTKNEIRLNYYREVKPSATTSFFFPKNPPNNFNPSNQVFAFNSNNKFNFSSIGQKPVFFSGIFQTTAISPSFLTTKSSQGTPLFGVNSELQKKQQGNGNLFGIKLVQPQPAKVEASSRQAIKQGNGPIFGNLKK